MKLSDYKKNLYGAKFNNIIFGGGKKRTNSLVLKTIISALILVFTSVAVYIAFILIVENHDSVGDVMGLITTLFALICLVVFFLSYLFKSKRLGKILYVLFVLIIPYSIYMGLQKGPLVEKEVTETILKKIRPDLIPYSIYIYIIAGIIFEITLRLLGKKYVFIGVRIKENPYKIRAYFLVIMLAVTILIEVF